MKTKPDWSKFVGCMRHVRDSGVPFPMVQFEVPVAGRIAIVLTRDAKAVLVKRKSDGERLAVLREAGGAHWHQAIRDLPHATKTPLWSFLLGLASDPEEELRKAGRDLGFCCICGHPISRPESKARGMGPDCWERMFGS